MRTDAFVGMGKWNEFDFFIRPYIIRTTPILCAIVHRPRPAIHPVPPKPQQHISVFRRGVRIQQHLPVRIGFLPSPSSVVPRAAVHRVISAVFDTPRCGDLLPGPVRSDVLRIPDRGMGVHVVHVHIGCIQRHEERIGEDVQAGMWVVPLVHDDNGGIARVAAGVLAQGDFGQGVRNF